MQEQEQDPGVSLLQAWPGPKRQVSDVVLAAATATATRYTPLDDHVSPLRVLGSLGWAKLDL